MYFPLASMTFAPPGSFKLLRFLNRRNAVAFNQDGLLSQSGPAGRVDDSYMCEGENITS
jgi:hypothetical protein